MVSERRTIYRHRWNKVFNSKFHRGYLAREESNEDRMSQRLKPYVNNNFTSQIFRNKLHRQYRLDDHVAYF